MKSINSSVTKSNGLNKDDMNSLAVRYQEAFTRKAQDTILKELWMAIKQDVISILSSTFPAYYNRYYEEMLQQAAEYMLIELPKYNDQISDFITFIKPIVIHAGQDYINDFAHMISVNCGAETAKTKK